MRATARVVAVADRDGGTRLAVLRGQAPLLPRRTGPTGRDEPARVHLVSGAAGPLGGDDLTLDVEVGCDARLALRSVAASVVLPHSRARRSRLTVRVLVEAGGSLDLQPEPLIAAAGCDHETSSVINLAAGARLTWREELVCGRHREPCGDVRLASAVRYGGTALLQQEMAVGPRAPGWDGPAVLHRARATATLLLVDPAWTETGAPPTGAAAPASTPEASAAWLPLPGPGVLVSSVGEDLPSARIALDRLTTDILSRTDTA